MAKSLYLRARTIAIIGAGPSGVAAAKYLRAEKAFDKIVLFEQLDSPGGIWSYTGNLKDEDLFTVPQTDPRGKNQDPPILSPIYKNLETNIPRGLMRFQDLEWPQESQLFPNHETVRKYIVDYGSDVQDLVQYETQVLSAEPIDEKNDGAWKVLTRNIQTNEQHTEQFDAVIVANGHFIVPHIPEIPGIREWNAKFPGAITHSKYYRVPEDFTNKKVVVVGNSASGSDISTQISELSQHPLLWSSRSDSIFKPAPSSLKRELPPIAEFLPATRGVRFQNGVVENDIDAVLFATGYFYSLPFLENVHPKLITDGSHVNYTYKHIFYAPRPTLSFLVLNQRVIPFPVAEAQSAVLARVYSGRLALPPLPTMEAWEQENIQEMGNGRKFHLMPFPKDGNYINELNSWALTAPDRDGLANDGKGKRPPSWGEWEFWCRENFPKIRMAFAALGEKRFQVRTLEEVGFHFDDYLKERAGAEGKLV